jgi:hypothetical protein
MLVKILILFVLKVEKTVFLPNFQWLLRNMGQMVVHCAELTQGGVECSR